MIKKGKSPDDSANSSNIIHERQKSVRKMNQPKKGEIPILIDLNRKYFSQQKILENIFINNICDPSDSPINERILQSKNISTRKF